ANASIFVLQVTGSLVVIDIVHHVALQGAEDEMQHVEKVHTNVRGDTKGFAWVALPALHVPLAATGDVGQFDFVLALFVASAHALLQIDDGLVMPKLQNVVETFAGFALHQSKVIEQLRGRHQRLFTDDVAAETQASRDMGMVQIVRRADRDVIESSRRITLEARSIIVKPLELGEKLAL